MSGEMVHQHISNFTVTATSHIPSLQAEFQVQNYHRNLSCTHFVICNRRLLSARQAQSEHAYLLWWAQWYPTGMRYIPVSCAEIGFPQLDTNCCLPPVMTLHLSLEATAEREAAALEHEMLFHSQFELLASPKHLYMI
jgi:hypothetical protein